MWDQGKRESHKQIYTGSLLHQELHPVPRNHWIFYYAINHRLQLHTLQRSDLEPLKKTHFHWQYNTHHRSEQPLNLHTTNLHRNTFVRDQERSHQIQLHNRRKYSPILFTLLDKIQSLKKSWRNLDFKRNLVKIKVVYNWSIFLND